MVKKYIKEYILIGVLILFVVLVTYGLGSALVPLLISTFLAYASLPLVKYLEAKGLTRGWSTAVVLSGVTLILTLAFVIAIPPLMEDIQEALTNLPQHLLTALEKTNVLLNEYGINVPYDKDSLVEFSNNYFQNISKEVFGYAGNVLKNSVASATSVVVVVLNITLVPIFFVYVINDYENFINFFKSLVPLDWKPRFEQFLKEGDRVLNGFIRGQLLVCTVLATFYATGLLIVGLKFGILIGCLTGLFTFIPYVGFGFGLIAAVVVALAHLSEGSGQLIGVAIVYGLGQMLETYIVTPRIVGNKVGLSAFEAILSLIVFGNLLGFVGLFLAIPVGAIVKIILRDALVAYRNTHFYKDLNNH